MKKITSAKKNWISGQWIQSKKTFETRSPWNNELSNCYSYADESTINDAIESSTSAFYQIRCSALEDRKILLERIAHGILSKKNDFITLMASEIAKPIQLAEIEVQRAATVFLIAAKESLLLEPRVISSNTYNQGINYESARIHMAPLGPILAIGPFNFPLNLLAHKIAPAIAAGCSVIVKPPLQSPGPALLLAEIFENSILELDLQKKHILLSAIQVLCVEDSQMNHLVTHPSIPCISFTGSESIGWKMKELAYNKKVVLELGGNASAFIDDRNQLNTAAEKLALSGFSFSGQICISLQRIFIAENIYDDFLNEFLSQIKNIKFGDPFDQETLGSALINKSSADRITNWIETAISQGAIPHNPINRTQQLLAPLVLSKVPENHPLQTEEVFGPVVVLNKVKSADEALKKINQSRFGLQASLFTPSQSTITKWIRECEVGGLIINDTPSVRLDHLPYGGVKKSGIGREGVKSSILEYCATKTILKRI